MKNDKNPIFYSFSSRRFKYGVFSTMTVVFVIALLVVVNLVVGQMNLTLDLTKNKMFSISDKTKDFLKTLDEEITIYTLFKTGAETTLYSEVLNQYSAYSNKITIENRDPYIYKAFIDQFDTEGVGIEPDSVIIVSSKRSKIIQASEFVKYSLDWETYTESYEFDLEPRVTNAIFYVTQEASLVAYELTGHGEEPLSDSFKSYLNDASYLVKSFTSARSTAVPEDCDVLIITAPANDIETFEADIIREYMQSGGSVMFCIGYQAAVTPNLMSLVEEYGFTISQNMVFEGDTNYYLSNNNSFLSPALSAGHAISNSLDSKNNMMFIPYSVSVEKLPNIKSSLIIFPLLTTSKSSFAKNNPVNMDSAYKETGDLTGPFDISVAVVNDYVVRGTIYASKVVIVGSDFLMLDQFDKYLNKKFAVSALNWLVGRSEDDSVFITAKSFEENPAVIISQSQAMLVKVFSWVIFPVCIMGIGVFIWLRRRNK